MAIKSANTGGAIFKPTEHFQVAAMLFDVVRIDTNVPRTFPGSPEQLRDEVIADVTFFDSAQDAELGQGRTVPNMLIGSTALVNGLKNVGVGNSAIQTVKKVKNYYAFGDVPGPIEEHVVAYYEAREQARAGAAADMDALL